jgi:nicotinamide-nucleotide amidase
MIELAERVVTENTAAGRRIVLAESCTGGLVCAAITEIAGSSQVLDRGFVTYSNDAKIESLGVSAELVDTFGAVSPAVAWAMARGALKHSEADIAVAITGVAGPGGGTESKPVGTVVFACAIRGQNENAISAEQKNFDPGLSRAEIRQEAAMTALALLLP